MTITEFIRDVTKVQDWLQTDFTSDVMVFASQDMVSLIANRVRETGVLGSGKAYPYKDGSYKNKRAKKGMMTSAKNYEFTTEMWRGFGVKAKEKLKVSIGGRTETSQDRINWNSDRDGDDIIAPNGKEEQHVADFIANKIQDYLNATFVS